MSEERPNEDAVNTPAPEPDAPAVSPDGGGAVAVSGETTSDERNMAMLCHILGIFTGFLGALIIWLIKKDQSGFVDDQGKEALNFQITMMIGWVISSVTVVVFIGCLLAPVLFVANLILCIMAGMAASKGQMYRYPFALRLIK